MATRLTESDASMGLMEHLEELRRRLIIVGISILAAGVVGFILSDPVIEILIRPIPDDVPIVVTTVGGAFAVKLKVSLFIGVALSIPVILYHVWRFVTPGLTPGERRLIWPFLGLGILLFVTGVTVGYIVIPFAIQFLLGFAREGLYPPLLTLEEFIGFETTMLLVFGLVLEFPIVLITMARVGILSHTFLARRRRWAFLLFVVFAIVATPGGDPLSPIILTTVMYLLFEATLLAIRFIRPR